jgi:hypothetical protein
MQPPLNPDDPGSGGRPAASRASEDGSLVRRIAAGEQAALGELYDRYGGMLLALATRVLDSPGEAEEVVQETFIQVWNKARSYDPVRSSVSTWLVLLGRGRPTYSFVNAGKGFSRSSRPCRWCNATCWRWRFTKG